MRSDWRFSRIGAIVIENAEHVEVTDGEITEVGGNGVVVNGEARFVGIRRNEIYEIGASAISFVGRPDAVRSPLFEYHQSMPLEAIDRKVGPKSENYPADSIAEDNLIHDIGFLEKQSAGIQISMAARITASHNSIYRMPRAGINIGDGAWGGHLIADNDVFDTVRETGDHGAFNSWGRDRYWHPNREEMDRRTSADRSLTALDVVEPIILRHNRWRSDHGWDVDLDDGASNYIIEDNLMLSGGLKLREGFDRTVRNNILLNNTLHPHVWFVNSEDVFEHNIVMTAYQPIRIPKWGKRMDNNLLPSQAALD
ncbi:right-handed parallel beta-helix repeat-containing protein [Caulobacter sp. UNC279MFTsu5.1]|uniref:right-handed parallel beta-helix repeat-containing protein n=1 Tax=Caulobacter sp. UNC279MFTsu5.1 TaxID=1502775 RepID=UPI0003A72F21|nr:right-handed parallel beta-helix repeat-containing protein [Caulobacter sp. UNC279MFTsu5.1]SFK13713.1 Right handed beta helix region [Caulobacter sp. UNC279MFTsu5.1]